MPTSRSVACTPPTQAHKQLVEHEAGGRLERLERCDSVGGALITTREFAHWPRHLLGVSLKLFGIQLETTA